MTAARMARPCRPPTGAPSRVTGRRSRCTPGGISATVFQIHFAPSPMTTRRFAPAKPNSFAFCVAALEDALGGGAPGIFNTD